jgi:hypothetical protein
MRARREMAMKGRAFGNVQPSTRMTQARNRPGADRPRPPHTRALVPFLGALTTLGVSAFSAGFFGPAEATARAEGTASTAAGPSAAPASFTCEIKGTPLMPKGANLWANAQASSLVASFAGQPIGVVATSFSSAGRVKVRTSGGVRIDGFVDAKDLPLYTSAEVPVVAGHLWIAPGQRVGFTAAPSGLTIEAPPSGPVSQSLRASSPCSSLSLDKRPRPVWDVPGFGRGYLPRRESLELRAEPGGAVIQTLRLGQPGAMLLWSTETRDGYVHVEYHEDLVLDAWVAAADLGALKVGETMDRLAQPSTVTGSARLALAGQSLIVRAQKDVPLRLSTKEGAPPVGFVEAGGEVYVTETVLGWSAVLPRALNVLPPDGHSFWVPAGEVGTTRP